MNSVSLVGRPTRSPELRYTQSGVAVASMTLAVQRNYKNADGEYEADFINLVAWRNTAEFMANYCDKGLRVGVTGVLQSRTYENKEGNTVFVTEVNVEHITPIDWKEEAEEEAPKGNKGNNKGNSVNKGKVSGQGNGKGGRNK